MALNQNKFHCAQRRTSSVWGKGPFIFILCCLLSILLHIPFLFWSGPHTVATSPSAIIPRVSYYTPPQPNAPAPTIPKQVVRIPEPVVAQRPQQADVLSQWDNTVAKQTRNKHTSTQPMPATSSPKNSGQGRVVGAVPWLAKKEGNAPVSVDKNAKKKDLQKILFPSRQKLQKQMHIDFADAFPELPVGASTQLNTLRWRHATFFNRVKEQVAQAWHPSRQLERYNPEGFGITDTKVATLLLVTLNRQGELIDVITLQSSGFAYLDEAAQTAFWQAQPFLKPPAALFAQQEQVSFRFAFFVEKK